MYIYIYIYIYIYTHTYVQGRAWQDAAQHRLPSCGRHSHGRSDGSMDSESHGDVVVIMVVVRQSEWFGDSCARSQLESTRLKRWRVKKCGDFPLSGGVAPLHLRIRLGQGPRSNILIPNLRTGRGLGVAVVRGRSIVVRTWGEARQGFVCYAGFFATSLIARQRLISLAQPTPRMFHLCCALFVPMARTCRRRRSCHLRKGGQCPPTPGLSLLLTPPYAF